MDREEYAEVAERNAEFAEKTGLQCEVPKAVKKKWSSGPVAKMSGKSSVRCLC